MQKILEELYHGNLTIGEGVPTAKAYNQAVKEILRLEDLLKERLNKEQWELLQSFQKARSIVEGLESTQHFVEAFRLGARIMLAILTS